MRVISGEARGVKLKTIEGMDTRPTTDRVKEATFSRIQHEIFGTKCLDLFSGSGALGIELLSRGADSVLFMENSKVALEIIRENLEKTKLIDRAILNKEDVYKGLTGLKSNQFDIIMMDPPYNSGHVQKILGLIVQYDLLTKSGIIVVEHDVNDPEIFEAFISLKIEKTKKYGKIGVTILRRTS